MRPCGQDLYVDRRRAKGLRERRRHSLGCLFGEPAIALVERTPEGGDERTQGRRTRERHRRDRIAPEIDRLLATRQAIEIGEGHDATVGVAVMARGWTGMAGRRVAAEDARSASAASVEVLGHLLVVRH